MLRVSQEPAVVRRAIVYWSAWAAALLLGSLASHTYWQRALEIQGQRCAPGCVADVWDFTEGGERLACLAREDSALGPAPFQLYAVTAEGARR